MRQITFQDALQPQSTQTCKLGERAMTPDGRIWVYVKDSGSAMSKGHIAVPAAVATVAATIVTSSNAYSEKVYLYKASAGWTVGAYANGWVTITAGTGTGQVAKIKDNTADTLELYPEYALSTATDGTSTASIWTQYVVRKAVVTTQVQNTVGGCQAAFTASYYGWVLRSGIGYVIAGDTLVVGCGFTPGDDTAGQVIVATTAKGTYDEESLGVAIIANSAADVGALVEFRLP